MKNKKLLNDIKKLGFDYGKCQGQWMTSFDRKGNEIKVFVPFKNTR